MPNSGGAHFVGTRWTSATRLPTSDSFITPSEDEQALAAGVQQSCRSRAAGMRDWPICQS